MRWELLFQLHKMRLLWLLPHKLFTQPALYTRLKEQIHNFILNMTQFYFSRIPRIDKYALYKSIAYRFHVCVKFKFKFDAILATGKWAPIEVAMGDIGTLVYFNNIIAIVTSTYIRIKCFHHFFLSLAYHDMYVKSLKCEMLVIGRSGSYFINFFSYLSNFCLFVCYFCWLKKQNINVLWLESQWSKQAAKRISWLKCVDVWVRVWTSVHSNKCRCVRTHTFSYECVFHFGKLVTIHGLIIFPLWIEIKLIAQNISLSLH